MVQMLIEDGVNVRQNVLKVTRALYQVVLTEDENRRLREPLPITERRRRVEIARLSTALEPIRTGLSHCDYEWADCFLNEKKWIAFKGEKDGEGFRFLLREIMKVYARAIPIQIARWEGRYDLDPYTELFYEEDNEMVNTITDSIREVGRPAAKWEAILNQLFRIEEDGKLPEIRHKWRSEISRTLAQWYADNYPSEKAIQAKTISTKDLIKSELDRIEQETQTP
jgi:hypothetical protein